MTWGDDAACRDSEVELFFPDDDGVYTMSSYAKRMCSECPVWEFCLKEALSITAERDFGIFGGTTESERYAMRKGRIPFGRTCSKDGCRRPMVREALCTAHAKRLDMLRRWEEHG